MSTFNKKIVLTLSMALFLCFFGLIGQARAAIGSALNFTAASKAVMAINPLPAGMNTWTIAFWIKQAPQTSYQDFLSLGNYPGTGASLTIFIYAQYSHRPVMFDGTAYNYATNGNLIDDNNWHFIVYQQDGGGYVRSWTDGHANTDNNAGLSITFPSGVWTWRMFGNGLNTAANGIMDEIGFWTINLSQAQIDNYYNAGAGRRFDTGDTGIAHIYSLDEGTGNIAHDRVINNDATITDPVWVEGIVPVEVAVCDAAHCDLCEAEGVCLENWGCYWYNGACSNTPPAGVCAHNPPENCENCLTLSDCWHMCGYYRWFDDGDPGEGMACHENPDPASTCEWTENPVYGQNTRAGCLKFTTTYWDCPADTGEGCCKELANCSYGDVLIIGDWTNATSTPINFNYTDYTTDWTTSTPLFAPIFNILPTIATPILNTLGSVANVFGDQQAEALAASFSGGLLVIGGFANSFNQIFYGIPIFEGVSLIIAIMILKTIFELIVKIRALLKIT